ncbi:MAG: hypothetical protein AAGH40_08190 [Verrucomicrobiota bacterium]
MILNLLDKHLNFLRSASGLFAIAGLFFVSGFCSVEAQPSKDNDSRYQLIDRDEGERRLAAFRRQRLRGDYCFNFQLEHLPRREKTVRYNGTMWGTWNEQGALTRFQISKTALGSSETSPDLFLEVIIQNGANPSVWKRRTSDENFERISGDQLFEPLISGIVYSPFDLQMPFIFWDEFEYEGPVRVKSRIVQRFLMLAPDDPIYESRGIDAVRLSLDDTYDALFVVEVVGEEGKELSRFDVENFKKVQGQYIVKSITLKDHVSKDRTRFIVKEASVGLDLDPLIFDPVRPLDTSLTPALEFEPL